jgi:hypothetical protein
MRFEYLQDEDAVWLVGGSMLLDREEMQRYNENPDRYMAQVMGSRLPRAISNISIPMGRHYAAVSPRPGSHVRPLLNTAGSLSSGNNFTGKRCVGHMSGSCIRRFVCSPISRSPQIDFNPWRAAPYEHAPRPPALRHPTPAQRHMALAGAVDDLADRCCRRDRRGCVVFPRVAERLGKASRDRFTCGLKERSISG